MSTTIAELPNGTLVNFIERAARDPEFDVNKFALLLDKQQEMLRERARQEFNAAMARVEAEIGPIIRDRLNPAVNRKYATLEAINAVARPIYSKHGFAVRFGCDKPPMDGWMRVTCTVSHAGGYSEQNYLDSPVDVQQGARARSAVQAVGSTITYLRRYLLQMAWNIVLADDEDDDDGESMRAAAAATRRAPRIAEKAPAFEAPDPLNEPDGRLWLRNLDVALANAQTQDEVVQIAGHSSVGHATANAPDAVKARVSELLANAYGRFAQGTEAPELPEVEIAGAERAGA